MLKFCDLWLYLGLIFCVDHGLIDRTFTSFKHRLNSFRGRNMSLNLESKVKSLPLVG